MLCPRCNSPEAFRVEIAHSQGKISGSLSGQTTTHVGLLTHIQSSHGGVVDLSTAFARALAPPQRRFAGNLALTGVLMLFFGIGIPVVVIVCGGDLRNETLLFTLFFCSAALGAYVSWLVTRPEQRRLDQAYERAIETWKRSWVCARCGHSWIPDNPTQSS
jgi:hypothetical protein